MKLSGQQIEKLRDALISAFPEQSQLEQFVRFKFSQNLNAIAMGSDLKYIVFKLIQTAESQGWVKELIVAARESNPKNPELYVCAQELLPDESKINVQQTKEDLEADVNSPELPTRQAIVQPRPTQRWAFLVGVNTYTDSNNFGQLKFCVNDVLALEKILKQLGYEVHCLHDDRDRDDPLFPTRDNVEARLKEMCTAVRPNDLLWVHFACHGMRVERGASKKEPVLIMRDTQYALLEKRAFPVAEVEQYMRQSGAQQLVLTLDACHTGVEMGRNITDPEFIHNVYELAKGFALIAASTAQQVASEWQEKQHGVFTYYLLEGLSGQGDRVGKNFVTVDDLKNHVLDGLRRWGVKNYRTQEPTARTEGFGDMILADYRDAKLVMEKNRESEVNAPVKSQPTVEGGSTPRRLSNAAKKLLENQLNDLNERLEAVQRQMRTEGDLEKQLLLQRRADDLLKQIEKIQQQIES
ncbi:hypothetical protein NUACC21_60550 [Scytonema sp. NUACC21]